MQRNIWDPKRFRGLKTGGKQYLLFYCVGADEHPHKFLKKKKSNFLKCLRSNQPQIDKQIETCKWERRKISAVRGLTDSAVRGLQLQPVRGAGEWPWSPVVSLFPHSCWCEGHVPVCVHVCACACLCVQTLMGHSSSAHTQRMIIIHRENGGENNS